jgi:chromosome segregation ATPase
MPEPELNTDAEMISASEYKKLQRKYDRRNTTARKAEERVEGLEASMSRLESLVEGLTALVAQTDDDLRPAAADLVNQNHSRRSADDTSAQLTARLNQSLEDADADWEDERFDDARRVLDEINASGDLARASEVEQLIRQVIDPQDETSLEERIEEAVSRAIHGERRVTNRVDTGQTTVRTGGTVTRGDLANLDPRQGLDNLRAKVNQALDQIGT